MSNRSHAEPQEGFIPGYGYISLFFIVAALLGGFILWVTGEGDTSKGWFLGAGAIWLFAMVVVAAVNLVRYGTLWREKVDSVPPVSPSDHIVRQGS